LGRTFTNGRAGNHNSLWHCNFVVFLQR
jgi:hypothetical protein